MRVISNSNIFDSRISPISFSKIFNLIENNHNLTSYEQWKHLFLLPKRKWSDEYYVRNVLQDEHLAQRVLEKLCPKPSNELRNIVERQNYQGHLGHTRVLQNINLFRTLGFRADALIGKSFLEFGPGLGGLYPYALATNASNVSIIDKNHATRLVALLRGATDSFESRL